MRAIDPAAALVRTSLIIGTSAASRSSSALDADSPAGPGALFSDEIRCPIDVADLAAAVLELAASAYAGLLNVAGPEAVSRAELGRLVAERYGLDPARVRRPARAPPPAWSAPCDVRLDSVPRRRPARTRLRGVRETPRTLRNHAHFLCITLVHRKCAEIVCSHGER